MLLEGPAIEPLLAQVRDEYGSRVRIISADKVRSGGVGGFFAKQHYELSVEVPDESTEDRSDMAQRSNRADNGHTLERLLERAESQDRMDEPKKTASPSFGTASPKKVAPAMFGRATRAADDVPPENDFGADVSRSAALSDTGAAFAELMAGLDASGHTEIERPTPKVKPPREEVPTVRPFRPAAAAEAPVNPKPAQATTTPQPTPKPTPPPAPPPHVAEHSLADRIGGLSDSEVEVDPPSAGLSAAEAYGLNPEPVSPVGGRHGSEVTDNDPVVRNLMSVGMPESMAAQITGGDTYAGVLSVLAARPSAPGIPDGPGEILVLAGDLNTGVAIARQMLDQIGVPENHLLLAASSLAGTGLHSSRLISTPDVAAGRVDKLHTAENAWIIVMDAPVGGTNPLWVNEMCDALGATALWAIVDATRKTADTARHLRTLGEVEALVAHGVELTGDPASVLGLDLPIYSLDGKPATPHSWAAMLCARIASDVMPVAAAPRRVTRSVRP
ncbi:hypothetical protein HH310_03135 [Actinoplanes sp. TBRC 11911]|nr:hypothetical protein [Actinoplanes sp. TBRC 11911]